MNDATDELRRLLDERGVEWMPCAWEPQTETFYKNRDGVAFIATESTAQYGFLLRTDMAVNPEQAIAATLGRGACENEAPEPYYFVCSKCGIGLNFNVRFCPFCGAKVVGE